MGKQFVEHGVGVIAVWRIEAEPAPARRRAGKRVAVSTVAAPLRMGPIGVLVPAHGIIERGVDAALARSVGLGRNQVEVERRMPLADGSVIVGVTPMAFRLEQHSVRTDVPQSRHLRGGIHS